MGARLLSSVAFVVLAVVVIWAIGRVIGFRMSLVVSLLISVALTILLNLIAGAFSWTRRRTTHH